VYFHGALGCVMELPALAPSMTCPGLETLPAVTEDEPLRPPRAGSQLEAVFNEEFSDVLPNGVLSRLSSWGGPLAVLVVLGHFH
jgi:hypothetical protein